MISDYEIMIIVIKAESSSSMDLKNEHNRQGIWSEHLTFCFSQQFLFSTDIGSVWSEVSQSS